MLKLDLGAGAVSPAGFTPEGHAHGSEIYPLPYADASADVIRASHCLEHFPHSQVPEVLAEWLRVLKPGGLIQIAVPDFEKIAENYVAGKQQPTEGYVMGGQIDSDDYHKALFDEHSLKVLLAQQELVLIRRWHSDIDDCAALPISLNIEARKPLVAGYRIRGIMTAPRLGFNDLWQCASIVLPKFNINFSYVSGAFWDQCLTRGIKEVLAADPTVDYVLTLDYDSVFNEGHLSRLLEIAMAYPDIDALAPVQHCRHFDGPMFGGLTPDIGTDQYLTERFDVDYLPVKHAHFGLTLLRASALRKVPQPWFWGQPNPDGEWADGKTDPDMSFWRKWVEVGNTLYLAPRVPIGHLELMVRWPADDMSAMWQPAKDWETTRRTPVGAWSL